MNHENNLDTAIRLSQEIINVIKTNQCDRIRELESARQNYLRKIFIGDDGSQYQSRLSEFFKLNGRISDLLSRKLN